jgi:glycosyltransferase involved in cell wall biosynthesis
MHSNAIAWLPGQGNQRVPGPFQHRDLLNKWDIQTLSAASLNKATSGDVAVLQGDVRNQLGEDLDVWIADWKANNGRLIYDLDDAGDPLPEMDQTLALAADVITVSNPALQEHVTKTLTAAPAKVMLVPTFLEEALWRLTEKPRPENATLQIGYLGAKNEPKALDQILPALDSVQRAHAVEINVVGTFQSAKPPIGQRIGYPNRSAEPDFRQSEFITWLIKVAQWDIVLLPDQRNVSQKFWHAAALGGTLVCADTADLPALARHGDNCLLANADASDWETALVRLIEDSALRRSLAKNLRRELYGLWTRRANIEVTQKVLNRALGGINHG